MSYSSQCYRKILGKDFLRKKGFILAQRLRVQSIMVGRHGDRSWGQLFTVHLGKQSEMKADSYISLLLIQGGTQDIAHGEGSLIV